MTPGAHYQLKNREIRFLFVGVAHDYGLSTNCCLLNIKNLTTNRLFPVDTGADVSINICDPSNLTAADGSRL